MNQKNLVLLCLYFICSNITFSQIVNEGTLQIKSSTTVYFGKDNANTKSGSYNNNVLDSFIKIGYEDPNGSHRQLLLGFLPDSPANLNYNPGYDALMSDPREDELFYIIENDITK